MKGPFFDFDYDDLRISNLNDEDIEVCLALTKEDVENLRNNRQVSVLGYWLRPYWRGKDLYFDLNDRYADYCDEDGPIEYDADGERVITFTCIHLWNIEA